MYVCKISRQRTSKILTIAKSLLRYLDYNGTNLIAHLMSKSFRAGRVLLGSTQCSLVEQQPVLLLALLAGAAVACSHRVLLGFGARWLRRFPGPYQQPSSTRTDPDTFQTVRWLSVLDGTEVQTIGQQGLCEGLAMDGVPGLDSTRSTLGSTAFGQTAYGFPWRLHGIQKRQLGQNSLRFLRVLPVPVFCQPLIPVPFCIISSVSDA